MGSTKGDSKLILVIGGGIAGMTAAIEAADAGAQVVLLEKAAFLGGRVAAFNQYFPKLCPPSCGLEINFRRLRNHPSIEVLTSAELQRLDGEPGDYQAVIKVAPRYVTGACTMCGACVAACPTELPDELNYGLTRTKAIHVRNASAFPAAYAVERTACPPDCRACADTCQYGAIRLDQTAETRTLQVASVIVATGWKPYDAAKIDNLGYGTCANVVTNVVLERLASTDGPTQGKVLRPSDRQEPKSVAFVQCAGSRDHNHLAYCSGVCCSASLKQATYIRKLYPEAKVSIFYIDMRTVGRMQEFAAKVTADQGIELVKGKVGKIEEDPVSKSLKVTVEDVQASHKVTRLFDLVVLATGMVPQTEGLPSALLSLQRDEFGFASGKHGSGVYSAGCVKRPAEVSASVRDGTGAALKALQIAVGATHHG